MNKIKLLLVSVFLIALSLPAYLVQAQTGTTVEINAGNPIVLETGGSLTGIPLDIKNIVVSSGAQGLAAFDLTINWDAGVIRVGSLTITGDTAARGFSPAISNIDNTVGTFRIVGATTQQPYSTANLTLATFGITAVGSAGKVTAITVTVTNLADNALKEITPRTPVSAQVQIRAAAAGGTTGNASVSLVAINLSPTDSSILLGQTQQFTATGTYTDKSIVNITSLVTWTSSNQAMVAIETTGTNPGLVTGLAVGTTTIRAALGAVSAITTLTITKVEENPVTVTSPPENQVGTPTPPATTAPPKPGQTPAAPVPDGETSATNTPPTSPAAAAPPPELGDNSAINWWLFGGIGAGVVILGLVSYLLLRRR